MNNNSLFETVLTNKYQVMYTLYSYLDLDSITNMNVLNSYIHSRFTDMLKALKNVMFTEDYDLTIPDFYIINRYFISIKGLDINFNDIQNNFHINTTKIEVDQLKPELKLRHLKYILDTVNRGPTKALSLQKYVTPLDQWVPYSKELTHYEADDQRISVDNKDVSWYKNIKTECVDFIVQFEVKLDNFGLKENHRPIVQIGSYVDNTIYVFGNVNTDDWKYKLFNLGRDSGIKEYIIPNKGKYVPDRWYNVIIAIVDFHHYILIDYDIVLAVHNNYIQDYRNNHDYFDFQVFFAGWYAKNTSGDLRKIHIWYEKPEQETGKPEDDEDQEYQSDYTPTEENSDQDYGEDQDQENIFNNLFIEEPNDTNNQNENG